MPSPQHKTYISQINKAIDYIERNIQNDLQLEDIARAANFSPFHFHRIFKAVVGETIAKFTKRVRLEKAAMSLRYDGSKSITQVAFDCGFSSSQVFAREFKNYFGRTATSIESKNCNTESKNGKDFLTKFLYNEKDGGAHHITFTSFSDNTMKVTVKNLEPTHVAYIRNIGTYKGNSELFGKVIGKLCGRAGPRGLLGPNAKILTIYHDDPHITEESKLRRDVCCTVPQDTKVDGEISKQEIPGGMYAVSRFELKDSSEYEPARNSVFCDWLPESDYLIDNRPLYEIYLNDPKEDPEGKHIIEICIPVKPK